jgi:hypothetical protein
VRILASEEFYELSDCQLSLSNDGFDCLRRQISAVSRHNDVKMCLGRVSQVRMTACLMMDVETGSQESL